jgi:hypothetical protein
MPPVSQKKLLDKKEKKNFACLLPSKVWSIRWSPGIAPKKSPTGCAPKRDRFVRWITGSKPSSFPFATLHRAEQGQAIVQAIPSDRLHLPSPVGGREPSPSAQAQPLFTAALTSFSFGETTAHQPSTATVLLIAARASRPPVPARLPGLCRALASTPSLRASPRLLLPHWREMLMCRWGQPRTAVVGRIERENVEADARRVARSNIDAKRR